MGPGYALSSVSSLIRDLTRLRWINFNEKERNMRWGEVLRKKKCKRSKGDGWREARVQVFHQRHID